MVAANSPINLSTIIGSTILIFFPELKMTWPGRPGTISFALCVFAYPHLTVVMSHIVMGLPSGRSMCGWMHVPYVLTLTMMSDYNGSFALSFRHMVCLLCL